MAERLGAVSKKPRALLGSHDTGELSIEEVSGDVAGESIKLREMDEKSKSWLELMEEFEDDTDMDRVEMSGAFRALTLVVEISSVGKEMSSRLIVPAGYLTLPSRDGVDAERPRSRLVRLVNARARAMVVAAIVDEESRCCNLSTVC